MARPTLKDVALRAGVSTGTVSHVLNGHVVVAPATRAAVERAIADLGYVRDSSGRALRRGRHGLVVFMIPATSNPIFVEILRGIEAVAAPAGLCVLVCSPEEDVRREDHYLEQLAGMRPTGVLIAPMQVDNPRHLQLRDAGVPVVFMGRTPDGSGEWCTVGGDDAKGGALAADHLVSLGHQRMAFLGGTPAMGFVSQRYASGLDAFTRAGLPPTSYSWFQTERLGSADGMRAAEWVLSLPPERRPTGLVCGNDVVALGLLQHLVQQGLSVPDDFAVVGYDDIQYAAAATVPLTSVAQPKAEIGRTAARLLLAEFGARQHQHQNVVLPPELVARASTTPQGRWRLGMNRQLLVDPRSRPAGASAALGDQ